MPLRMPPESSLLLRTRKVPGSNLGKDTIQTETDQGFSWYLTGMFREDLSYVRFLPHPHHSQSSLAFAIQYTQRSVVKKTADQS